MIEYFVAWFVMMLPIIFAPNPINMVVSSAAAKQGIAGVLPLIIGINITIVVMSFIAGIALVMFVEANPSMLAYLKYFGAIYLSYSAFKFLKTLFKTRSDLKKDDSVLQIEDYSIINGVKLLYPSIRMWMMILAMFSVFFKEIVAFETTVVLLSVLLGALSTASYFMWAGLGAWIGKMLGSEQSVRIQNLIFSVMLIAVIAWLFLG